MQLGIDLERSDGLIGTLTRWDDDSERIIELTQQAETLSEIAVDVANQLHRIRQNGHAMAVSIQRACAMLTAFRIGPFATPRMALFLDLDIGSRYQADLAASALENGTTYRQAQIRRELTDRANRPRAAALLAEYAAIDPHNIGDLGGTLSTEIRDPYTSDASTAFEQGRDIVVHALADTADQSQIHHDEFQAIFHPTGALTLVLPGVTDLVPPQLGLDPTHRTARDADQVALRSLFDASVEHNKYAQLVSDWVRLHVETGAIEQGAPVLIVGHSFGADTALDLAADPRFNGGLVNITHVVSAAYHSEPQLPHLVNGTQVGVLQNIYDVPVFAEAVALQDTVEVVDSVARISTEVAETALEYTARGMNGAGWLVQKATQLEVPELPTTIEIADETIERIEALDGSAFVAEFEGPLNGAGHHQDGYSDYLRSELNDPITSFLTDIGRAGYGAPGISISVDISLPADQ